MTREEILAMKPGRELDAMVAEKVLGLKVTVAEEIDRWLWDGTKRKVWR